MPEPIIGTTQGIAEALTAGFKLLSQVISGADQRRLRAGVDIADRIFKKYRDDGGKDKTIIKWIDEFYDRIA